MHDWKKVSVEEYYSQSLSNLKVPLYFICTNCGAKCKIYGGDLNNEKIYDNDYIYRNNAENKFLTCKEIIIKSIIK